MIRVDSLIAWSEALTLGRLELRALRFAHLCVHDLERSVDFYRRVFGFHPAGGRRQMGGPSIAVVQPCGARLVLHESRSPAVEILPMCRRFGFVVTDLERAREDVWELGVEIASDSGDPDHIYRWPNGRSLYVHDPDAHALELVDMGPRAARFAAADARAALARDAGH
jgi:catechol 2,3-dioxygenase-like lactoylglutathione lyase family enzyme